MSSHTIPIQKHVENNAQIIREANNSYSAELPQKTPPAERAGTVKNALKNCASPHRTARRGGQKPCNGAKRGRARGRNTRADPTTGQKETKNKKASIKSAKIESSHFGSRSLCVVCSFLPSPCFAVCHGLEPR